MSSVPKRKYKLVDISEAPVLTKKAWGATATRKPTIVPWHPHDNRNEILNDWFHIQWEDEVCPRMFAQEVAGRFHDFLQAQGLELALHPNKFRGSLCSAICTFAFNTWYEKKLIGAPKSLQPLPKGWSPQTILIWQDYIQSFYLTDHYFERFWTKIPTGLWEVELSQIRNYLQSILVYYIKYDSSLLQENELIAVNSEGEWVDPLEADIEETEETWD